MDGMGMMNDEEAPMMGEMMEWTIESILQILFKSISFNTKSHYILTSHMLSYSKILKQSVSPLSSKLSKKIKIDKPK